MTQDKIKIIDQLQQIIASITAAGGTVSDELQHQVTLATQQILIEADANANNTNTQKKTADYTGILNGNYDAITKNTFMDDDFYRFLFNAPLFRGKKHNFIPEDKIEFTVTKLEIMAKNIGGTELLRSFKKMCKLKKEEVKKNFLENKRKEREEQERRYAIDGFMTKFKDLPDISTGNKFVSPEWDTSLGFVTKEELKKDGTCGKITTVCGLPALINRRVVKLGTNTEIEEYEILYKDGDNKWRTKIVERGKLINSKKVIELGAYGLCIDSSMATNFSGYMLSMISEQAKRGGFPAVYSTDKLLIKKDEKLVATYTDKDLIFSKQDKFPGLLQSLQPVGDKNEWYEAVKKLRKAPHSDDFNYILATMFTPLLVTVLGTQGFVNEIYGASQTGKSAMLKVCSTVWGGFNKNQSFVFSANSTDCHAEISLDALNSLPYVVDDFNELDNDKKRQFAQKIMIIANGKTRGRSNKNLEQVSSEFSLTATIGAEEPISTYLTNGGAYNRLISKRFSVQMGDVAWHKENGDSAVGDILRFFSDNHGHAGIDFINKINEIDKKEIEKIKDNFDGELRKRAKNANKSDGQVQPLAIIMTASYLIEKFLFRDGIVMTYDDALACMTDADIVDQSMRFYYAIENKFSLNADKFEGTHDDPFYDRDPANFRGGCWGVYKEKRTENDGETETHRILNVMPAIMEKWALEEKINIKMFYDNMLDRGFMLAETGRTTKKVKLKHLATSPRMIQILLPVIKEEEQEEEKKNEQENGHKSNTILVTDDGNGNAIEIKEENIKMPEEWRGIETPFSRAADEVKELMEKQNFVEYNEEEDPFSDID